MSKRSAWLQKFAWLMASCLVFCLTTLEAAVVNGQSYVSLTDWGRANGLSASRPGRGDELVLANQTTRLVFDADSRYADVNGVRVALSFPIANAKGAWLIAPLDLDTAVRPLLGPPKWPAKRITTICLDPGHGGKDTGNRVGWHYEKIYTLALAATVRDQLKQAGFNVILTRTRDTSVDLPDRPALANRRGADLFVSLHFNATPTGRNEVDGPQTYCITPVGASSTDAQGEGSNHGPDAGEPRRTEKSAAGVSSPEIARAQPRRRGPGCAAGAFRRAARRHHARHFDRRRLHDASGRGPEDLQRCLSPPDGAGDCEGHSGLPEIDFTAGFAAPAGNPASGGQGRQQYCSETFAGPRKIVFAKSRPACRVLRQGVSKKVQSFRFLSD